MSTITIKKLTAASATRIEELERELVQLKRRDKLAAQIECLDDRLLAARDAAVEAERKFDAWMIEHSTPSESGEEAAERNKAKLWEAVTMHFRMKRGFVEEHEALLEERREAKRQIANDCLCQDNEYDNEHDDCVIAATKDLVEEYGRPNSCNNNIMFTYCRFCERVLADAPPLFALGITLYEHNKKRA